MLWSFFSILQFLSSDLNVRKHVYFWQRRNICLISFHYEFKRSHKNGAVAAVRQQIFLGKSCKHTHFLTANKRSCQPLAELQNLDPAANPKPYTWHPFSSWLPPPPFSSWVCCCSCWWCRSEIIGLLLSADKEWKTVVWISIMDLMILLFWAASSLKNFQCCFHGEDWPFYFEFSCRLLFSQDFPTVN